MKENWEGEGWSWASVLVALYVVVVVGGGSCLRKCYMSTQVDCPSHQHLKLPDFRWKWGEEREGALPACNFRPFQNTLHPPTPPPPPPPPRSS